ncbi:insulinase family protein [Aliiglaciecola sp.]|nr:insulinase family protein [Aliiglaciecola sp.]
MQVSHNDKREYAYQVLENGMRCIAVFDPDCKKSAASISVNAGHFDDPQTCCGLAHLLEHLLFNGSAKYPNADEFNQYLGMHTGSVNAWTGTEYTNYHFDVSHANLQNALDYFKDMLFYPTLTTVSIEKEVSVIDDEFKLKINDDLRRLYQVHKETCNPAHPFSKFSVGNSDSFAAYTTSELQNLLKRFHHHHYVPQNCCLCVISNSPKQEIISQIIDTFSPLTEATHLGIKSSLPPLYLPKQLGVLISINPIKDARRLIVSFALPDVQSMYKSKPLELISHLIGDEGKGGLLCFLKGQNWVTNLSAGGGINGTNFKDFNINLQLTKLGKEHIDGILNALFYFVSLIKNNLNETWRIEEKAALSQLAFDYSEPSKPVDEAQHISNQMFHYPSDEVLSGDYLVTNTSTEDIEQCLFYLSPENMRLKLICKDVETDRKSAWYHTPYKVEPLHPERLKCFSQPTPIAHIQLPQKNSYIVEQCITHPVRKEFLEPQFIRQLGQLDVWFAQDDVFRQPKGDCFISFDCAAVSQGAMISAHKRLWIGLMAEHINDQFYAAGIAGLNYHLYPHQGGFTLHTSGFSEKQMGLAEAIIRQIFVKPDLSNLFEQVKHRHIQNLQNTLLNKPINRLFNRLSGIVQRYSHAPTELLACIQNTTLEALYQTRDRLLENYFVEVFACGNWVPEQVINFASSLQDLTGYTTQGSRIKRDVVDLKNPQRFINEVQSQHADAAIVVYLQTPSASKKEIALTILVEQLFASPFFHEMRNTKQLGYLVGSGYLPLNQHPGMVFYIQSPHQQAQGLLQEIDDFLSEMTTNISDMKDIWPHVRNNIIKQLDDNDTSLSVKSQRLWLAIGNDDHDFNQQQALIEELQSLTFDDICNFAKNLRRTENFGSLILYCEGENNDAAPISGDKITDLATFKSEARYMV